MKRTAVESSHIKGIGYEDGVLEVEFIGGAIYQYKKVPPKVYQDFMESPSKGKFLRELIKEGFTGEKLLERLME